VQRFVKFAGALENGNFDLRRKDIEIRDFGSRGRHAVGLNSALRRSPRFRSGVYEGAIVG